MIAESFARIFFRNSINIGLVLIECPEIYDDVNDGDTLTLNFKESEIQAGNRIFSFGKHSEHLSAIIAAGGLIESMNNRRTEVEQ